MKKVLLLLFVIVIILAACCPIESNNTQGRLTISTMPTTHVAQPTTTVPTSPTPTPKPSHPSTATSLITTTFIRPTTIPTSLIINTSTKPSSSTVKPTPGHGRPVYPSTSPYIEAVGMVQYDSYLQSGLFPDRFITLERLPKIGEMICVTTYTREKSSWYMWGSYEFVADLGSNYRVKLTAIWNGNYPAQGENLTNQYTGDLRQISSDYRYAYLHSGEVLYNYYDGVLESASWVYGDYWFNLSFNQNNVLPITEDTTPFIRDLLHTDTAEQAMETFKASMESAAVK